MGKKNYFWQQKNYVLLGLQLPTDPRWVSLAEMSIADILTDHAYCELKAATTCISLIQLNPEKTFLVEKIAPVVNEEWEHFRMVLEELKKRNLSLGYQRKDEYANLLQGFATKGGKSEERFTDKLLMSALIEARSCERFRLLSNELSDESLKVFYHKLMKAEAMHYKLFMDIAIYYSKQETVKKRWFEWLEFEKEIMKKLELRGDRIH